MLIEKSKESMTSRERVRRTFEFEKTDRVTIGYDTNPTIHTKFCRALGLPNDDLETMYRALGVDYQGVRGVDTLQPEAVNMSPRYLAEHFGGRLNFRGCISTAGPLAYGTPEEVDAVCKDTLEVMMPVRGYHFAPTHQIQDNTPVENLIAMYNAAHKYGRY